MRLKPQVVGTTKNESFIQYEYIKRQLMRDGYSISPVDVRDILEGRETQQPVELVKRVLILANREPVE